MRPHQWVKNAFVAAPLFFTPDHMSVGAVLTVLAGIIAFSAVASGVYVLNDYMDREADRQHPSKRKRPFAAGAVSPGLGLGLMVGLMIGGLVGAVWLSRDFALIVFAYLVLNTAYSFYLKHLSIIDVMVVALGFVLRVYAGGVLIGIVPTVWIIACTMLLAMFIALAKRRDDLVKGLGDDHRPSLKGYNRHFLDTALAVVLASLLVSYLLYTTDPANMRNLGTDRLFLTVPFVMAGVLRYLQITLVEERSGSPTTVVLQDRFMLVTVLGWIATFAILIYG
jgi:4-hydroxybenzoate polyprenyltransferase